MFFIDMASLVSFLYKNAFDYVNIRTLLLGSLVFLLLSWIVRTYRTPSKCLPPGPLNLPILGCLPLILKSSFQGRSLFDVLQTLHQQYGPVCYVPLPFGVRVVVISGYKAVHDTITTEDLDQRSPTFNFKSNNSHEVLKGNGELID